MVNFTCTRGIGGSSTTISDAIFNPAAYGGGLYVPKNLPTLDLEKAQKMSYLELTLHICELFGLQINGLQDMLEKVYQKFDNPAQPVDLKQAFHNKYVIELYHGPTRAFKDMALAPLMPLLNMLAMERNKKLLILAATSGDTGPAILAGAANLSNVSGYVMYPDGGTSLVQKLQMTTVGASNLRVVGVNGNFDNCQTHLKNNLLDTGFKESLEIQGYDLGAANSVNFGRLLFQIVYHVYAYFEIIKDKKLPVDTKVNYSIPSGNFGNAMACYYAKKMGLPVGEIMIASNSNNVLTSLFSDGLYNPDEREFVSTSSPAMDILKSSNIERLMYHEFGVQRTVTLFSDLSKNGRFQLTTDEVRQLDKTFLASSFNDNEILTTAMSAFGQDQYLIDPHTATAYEAAKVWDPQIISIVVCSTAEYTKFPSFFRKFSQWKGGRDNRELLEKISTEADVLLPDSIVDLFSAQEIQTNILEIPDINSDILKFLS